MKNEIEDQINGQKKATTESFFNYTFWSYIIGFVSSIVLTVAAYFLAVNFTPLGGGPTISWTIALIIAVLALVQFVVQLFFFMHLRLRTKPRWQLGVFLFMMLVVLILVGGSIWIMSSLNNRMIMTPDQVNQYMQDQAGL